MPISAALGSSALLPAGLGFRNLIINGDFKVWQRGTGPSAMATGLRTGWLADRWYAARAGYASGGTVSRQSAGLEGFQYCSRIQRDSGNSNTAIIYYFQTLESVNSIPLAGKTITFSFYARAGANFSGSSNNLTVAVYSGTATDQQSYPDANITGSQNVIFTTVPLTTSWQRFTLQGYMSPSGTQLFAGFVHSPTGTAGAADFFEITGIQLEQNMQATPFEQRPFGLELSLCQRYYEKSAPGYYLISGVYGSSAYINVIYKERKRANPSVSGLSAGSFDGTSTDNFGVGQSGNAWVLTSWEANAEL